MAKRVKVSESRLPENWEFDGLFECLRQKVTKGYLDTLTLPRGKRVEYATSYGLRMGYYLRHNNIYVEIATNVTHASLKPINKGAILEPGFSEETESGEGTKYLLAFETSFGDLHYFRPMKE